MAADWYYSIHTCNSGNWKCLTPAGYLAALEAIIKVLMLHGYSAYSANQMKYDTAKMNNTFVQLHFTLRYFLCWKSVIRRFLIANIQQDTRVSYWRFSMGIKSLHLLIDWTSLFRHIGQSMHKSTNITSIITIILYNKKNKICHNVDLKQSFYKRDK